MATIEEKAKAYDEAIEKLSNFYRDYDTISRLINVKEELANLIPALKESEDERIRKELIEQVVYIAPNDDEIDSECNVLPTYQKRIDKYRAWLEKQGEQILANSAKTCKIEPSTWSEEDEDNFKHLMDEIVCLGNSRNSANRLHYDRLIKFLDELKNRVQPREEWCDKDERMLDRLIAYFEKRVAFTDNDNPRYANWLKSLRPRTQWKPSERQKESLLWCVVHLGGADKQTLGELLEELNKL